MKLTDNEKAMVFMQYPGVQMMLTKSGRKAVNNGVILKPFSINAQMLSNTGKSLTQDKLYDVYEIWPWRLLLKPFRQIVNNEDDFLAICQMLKLGNDERYNRELLFSLFLNVGTPMLFYKYQIYFAAFRQLQLMGYDMPLYLGMPGHWANGKTAIKLNLAVDATTIM